MVDGKLVNVSLYDTYHGEDYDRLRPLGYPFTDIFLVCFAVDSPTSFHNVRDLWAPEVKQFCPDTPILLLGMKSDLRESDQSPENLGQLGRVFITPQQAEEMAKEIGAVGYRETSSLTMTGVHETMTVAMRIGMRSKRRRRLIRCLKWPFEAISSCVQVCLRQD